VGVHGPVRFQLWKRRLLHGVSTYGGTDPNDGLVFGITP
jgi:hypothetical protein